jgi:DNA (cytosine-5)-methyltransferase 1
LFFDIADIIKRTRPKTFMLENVDNLLSHDKGNTFKVMMEVLVNELEYKVIGISKDLSGKLIYDNESFKRNSRNFGIPQNRPRVYIMGFDTKFYGDAIDELSDLKLPEQRAGEPIYNNLNELLEFKAPKDFYVAQGYLETLKNHRERHEGKGNGFGYMVVNEPKIKNPCSNAILATGGSGKERNLIYDPQEGIAGMVLKGKQTPLNNEYIRHMTPREWGKLQGFVGYAFLNETGEDIFSLPPGVSNTQLYKQFGNSVTIPVIEQMAIFMHKCIKLLENAKKGACEDGKAV